jgi:serine phosphatase RsbU (regulator of sigma subunit)
MKAVRNIETNSLVQAVNPAVVAGMMLEPAIRVTLPSLEPGIDQDLANELAIARAIQQSLLPKDFPQLPGFGLAAFCQSARHIGGDFYDVLPTGKASALLVIADVMGKGVPAALFAASLRILVRSFVEFNSRPSDLLKRINRQMFEELSNVDMFITAQVVLLDTERRLIQVASAGHCPLLVAGGLQDTQMIAPDGLPLGIEPFAEYAEQTALLPAGACALLYTDGLTEACNPSGNVFGQERLNSWLAQNAGLNLSAAQLKEQFLADFRRFQADTASRDDLTLLLLAEQQSPHQQQPAKDTWTAQE